MRLVIYSKAAWPESLLASIIEGKVGQQFGLESLLFFHLSKSSLFDQIRDQTAPGVRTSH